MPPMAELTPAQHAEAMLRGSSELKFLLAREEVPEVLQGKLFHVGIHTLARFSTVVDNAAELKAMLVADFGIDGAVSLALKVQVASVIVAFNAARIRTEKFAEVEGELQSRRLQKPMATSDYSAMRQAFEQKWWPLEDSNCPGRSYMEKRADDLESGDFRAEPLTTVLSRDEDQSECFQSYWDSAGQLQLRKGGTTVAEPQNPEALRKRIKLMGTSLMMLAIRHTNRANLQELVPQDWEDYLGYLLGDFVWLLTGRAADGSTVANPTWAQLLIYEFQIRKCAYHSIATTGSTLKEALKACCKDATIKERYFTTPVALSSTSKRPLAFNEIGEIPKRIRGNGRGRGRGAEGKGKGRQKGGRGGGAGAGDGSSGKGKGGKGGKAARADYCYAYNNSWERCKKKDCAFKHICMRCGGKHPVYQCTNAEVPAAPETQGQGEGST